MSYYPMDTIKTRIQASDNKNIILNEIKIPTLYKGSSLLLIMSIPAGFMYFLGYELGKKFIKKNNLIQNTYFINLFGGISAEIFNTITRTPIETIKQQMQIGLGKSIKQTTKDYYNAKGFKGFYSGFFPMLLREAPYSSFQMPIFEICKIYFKKNNLQQNKSNIEMDFKQSAITGIIAGSISGFMTVPMDVIKTKIMTDRKNIYNNFSNTFKIILKEEGIKGFFRGWYIRTGMIGITSVPFFVSYEQTRQFLLKKY